MTLLCCSFWMPGLKGDLWLCTYFQLLLTYHILPAPRAHVSPISTYQSPGDRLVPWQAAPRSAKAALPLQPVICPIVSALRVKSPVHLPWVLFD